MFRTTPPQEIFTSGGIFHFMSPGKNEERTPHENIWGKKAGEVFYGEPCPVCGSRIDEFGLCSCGAGGA
jgi:hypothetical protein